MPTGDITAGGSQPTPEVRTAIGLVATGAVMVLDYQRGETIIADPELDKFK